MTRNFELEAKVSALESLLELTLLPLWKASVPDEEQKRQIDSLSVVVRKSGDRNWDDPLQRQAEMELRRWKERLAEPLPVDG